LDIRQTTEALWAAHQAGDYYPQQWRNTLSVDAAYRIQLGLLEKKQASGAKHIGYKVGLTADVVRNMYDAKEPVFGYLLEEAGFRSGHVFTFADMYPPVMETEILVTLAEDLQGPTATQHSARDAIGTIAPAFEVPERRDGGLDVDFALGLVDNVAQRAYVWGEEQELSANFQFGDIRLELERNGSIDASVLGSEVMDHQLDTLAWLANALHAYGRKLHPGQRILTGSFTKPAPVNQGDHYVARFSGIGEVSMQFD
jgi:2-keto-4-pentenoate hydratase